MRTFRYAGMVRSEASWANVGRSLVCAAVADGWSAEVLDIVEDRYNRGTALPLPVSTNLVPVDRATHWSTTSATFVAPTDYGRLPTDRVDASLLAYESRVWPSVWTDCFNRSKVEYAIMPCEWARITAIESGFEPERVRVVFHGVDATIFFPSPTRTAEEIVFVFSGTSAYRKGLDVLLESWPVAFKPNDPVRLLIKLAPYADESARSYLDGRWRPAVTSLRERGFAIEVDTNALSLQEMSLLYRRGHALVAPIRGECAPLVILEAMACGLVPIATDYAGIAELVGDTGILLGSKLTAPCIGFLPACDEAHATMAEPSRDELIAALRYIATHHEQRLLLSHDATARAAQFPWSQAWHSLRPLLN